MSTSISDQKKTVPPHSGIGSVYGEPIALDGVTIIPVAAVFRCVQSHSKSKIGCGCSKKVDSPQNVELKTPQDASPLQEKSDSFEHKLVTKKSCACQGDKEHRPIGAFAAIPVGAYVNDGFETRFRPNIVTLLVAAVPFVCVFGRMAVRVIRALKK